MASPNQKGTFSDAFAALLKRYDDVIRLSAWSMIAAATGTVGSATARYTARAAARQWL